MIRTKISGTAKRAMYFAAVLSISAAAILFIAKINTASAGTANLASTVVASPETAFPANGATLGAVPDGPAACNAYGGNRDVTFTVAGMNAPLSNVSVSLTMSPGHTWSGDLDVRLIAPGGAPEHVIFSRTAATTATAAGDSSDVAGPYVFADSAPAAPTWWAAAAAEATGAAPIPAGSYRTSTAGEVAGGGANTLILPTFAALNAGQINGTWTLRFKDHCSADTGSVSAATLTLDGPTQPVQNVLDFNADGRTDFAVVRNTGGGPGGQESWFTKLNNGAGTESGVQWGISTDFWVPDDYDGDNKTDFAVWRPGAPFVASFYILNSATSTVTVLPFGVSGDDPTVTGDYTGDGKADPAVYRAGAAAGDQSNWYYQASSGPRSGTLVVTRHGQNGDFPAPGDYNGDGKGDFCIQRNAGGGAAAFWLHPGTGGTDVEAPSIITVFGTPTDVIVPGDYDADGKTDIAVTRGSGGAIIWFVKRSSDNVETQVTFGASATDFRTQGDYDGDGKTDPAVWRPSPVDGQSLFWYLGSTSGSLAAAYGKNGDYPVANYNSH